MKHKYMMLWLLIAGPKQPGNNVDVYLAPLVDDLRKLWDEGVSLFDPHANEIFILVAMRFCTINDFPAHNKGYKNIGKKACPICIDDMDPYEFLSVNTSMCLIESFYDRTTLFVTRR